MTTNAKPRARKGAQPRIQVQDADYDEERAAPVRVRSCVGRARLGNRGMLAVHVEDDIHSDGRVYFGIDVTERDGHSGSDISLLTLEPRHLEMIMETIQQTVEAARRRGIVRR